MVTAAVGEEENPFNSQGLFCNHLNRRCLLAKKRVQFSYYRTRVKRCAVDGLREETIKRLCESCILLRIMKI